MSQTKILKKDGGFKRGDIVKILAPASEQGRYAVILRSRYSVEGDEIFTLKMNNYWNSAENVKRFGFWEGQLWIAVTKNRQEIQACQYLRRNNNLKN